ncbi:MAG: SPOR domain-containing protein [Pseudomonadota bacterium]
MMTGTLKRTILAGTVLLLVAACEDGQGFTNPFQKDAQASDAGAPTTAGTGRMVERDVEAPDVFSVSEAGLWDGRPSLGGVWVAHPDVKEPERVIIRNEATDQFVIGALFRKERETPGPRVQVSSDAAAEIGMLAGQPQRVSVVALRRETVEEAPDPVDAPTEEGLNAPAQIEASELDPIAGAAAAIDAAEGTQTQTAAAAPAPTPAPAPRLTSSSLAKPFIQIGIFSVEQNAKNTAASMRTAGVVPTIKKSTSSGKTFWRVIVGPASNSAERTALLNKVKEKGFNDAYFVTN